MRKFINHLVGITLVLTPIVVYCYAFWLSIKLFLIPAFKLFFEMYGVLGTFGIWIGLSLVCFLCSYAFFWLFMRQPYPKYQATYKETK